VIIGIGKCLFDDARKMPDHMGEAWGRMMNCGDVGESRIVSNGREVMYVAVFALRGVVMNSMSNRR